MYLPRSSKGHTHALIIADLYSLYISFIPMKSKTAEATASALRNYISFMGVPKVLLTDNDPTFRSEVTTLLASFNIQHQTSFPYMQRGNTVESQVRKFLNAQEQLLQIAQLRNIQNGTCYTHLLQYASTHLFQNTASPENMSIFNKYQKHTYH